MPRFILALSFLFSAAAAAPEELPGGVEEVVYQRGFLASRAPDNANDDSSDGVAEVAELSLGSGGGGGDGAEGGIETSIGAGFDDDAGAVAAAAGAPARRLCGPVGYPCWINAECCSARCVSTHVCGPGLR